MKSNSGDDVALNREQGYFLCKRKKLIRIVDSKRFDEAVISFEGIENTSDYTLCLHLSF